MRSKVCGMTSAEQVMQLDEMGVEFAGFIFYPKSPRYAYRFMSRPEIKKIRGKGINKVGVFVNAEVEELLQTVDDCGLYLVQLHGDETPKYCEKVADYVSVIKAFRLRENENVLWKIKDYMDIVDMFLFDTDGTGYGGTGKKFNWDMLKGLTIGKPFFLSGGIGPDDAEALAEFAKDPVAKDLFSIDVNSRFEISPGSKDMDKLKTFIPVVKQL
ncbi:phosphoribosylanthranilate isomerase [Sediminibacterium soli]|uniref:phosphoribosylanthranilate isomerase n=1 Tax=Sediminibacterium soli TaxID=2698829 RepID=UPI00137B168A|nr:phosphoribosylanthranilate isomerase [Sediminibacterium soli]NCI46960.1 phosphoribosylanthranilate isomerase [Sediminibacterium soli]